VGELAIEEVGTEGALARLVPEWDELFARSAGATPYLSPAWVLPWWRHLGVAPGAAGPRALAGRPQLRAVAVRAGGSLVGLAPWCEVRLGVGPAAIDVVVGVGQETADDGGVLLGDAPHEVAAALVRHLGPRLRAGRTVYAATRLRDADPWLAALRGIGHGVAPVAVTTEPHPRIDLAAIDDPVRHVARLLKRNDVRRRWRRLEEAHGAAFSYHQASVDHGLAAFRALHEARWAAKAGDPDWLYRTGPGWAFLADAAGELHQRGMVRISLVTTASGQPVAGRLGFEHAGTYYGAKSGWDPAFARFGPGHLAFGRVLEHAAASGLATVDLMRGDGEHKRAWTDDAESVTWWAVGRSGALGAVQQGLLRAALSLRHRRARANL
jgi:CelD/BcsL family acetyltransferase involved in cellulose biosynthesis